MTLPRILSAYFHANKVKAITGAAVLVTVIALVDSKVKSNVGLGFLYLLPMLLVGRYLARWEIFLLAAVCAYLRETFAIWTWQADAPVRMGLTMIAYFGAGLAVAELDRARQHAVEQSRLRQEAEEQLRVLIESSPAAILTLDAEGRVLLANEAAHRLLGFGNEPLKGERIGSFLPVLTNVPLADRMPRFRTTMECTGRRRNGEVFLAHVYFSTYQTPSGPRLAAIVWDASENLRDREGLVLHSLRMTSGIVVGAVSHEVRNLSAAAGAAYANLARRSDLLDNEDFRALGTLVRGLEKLASSELRLAADQALGSVDLYTVLDELRIVIEPSFHESEAQITWDIAAGLPMVRGDHHSLLQVFLNLAQNSQRALQEMEKRDFKVTARSDDNWVTVRLQDSGPGIAVPDRLFQPFQTGTASTGLGLYVSRAILRTFGGELHHEPQPAGACFAVHLIPVRAAK